MSRNCVFQLPENSKEDMIGTFKLDKVLSNNRTDIFQNAEMRVSMDKKVVRVVVFDANNF